MKFGFGLLALVFSYTFAQADHLDPTSPSHPQWRLDGGGQQQRRATTPMRATQSEQPVGAPNSELTGGGLHVACRDTYNAYKQVCPNGPEIQVGPMQLTGNRTRTPVCVDNEEIHAAVSLGCAYQFDTGFFSLLGLGETWVSGMLPKINRIRGEFGMRILAIQPRAQPFQGMMKR